MGIIVKLILRRRKRRVWKILKQTNPELTKERFDETYDSVNNMLMIVSELQKESA